MHLNVTRSKSTDIYRCDTCSARSTSISGLQQQERWGAQSDALQVEVAALPLQMLLAAGFATYLARASETVRSSMVKRWCDCSGIIASSSSSSAQVRLCALLACVACNDKCIAYSKRCPNHS
jgi:hypothetical protein